MKIKLVDQTEADSTISLSIGADGTVTGNSQKVLIDDSDTPPTQTNDGDPVSFTLSSDDAQAVSDALAPIMSKYVNAPNGAGAGSGAGS